MAAFVALYEGYLGMALHFRLWTLVSFLLGRAAPCTVSIGRSGEDNAVWLCGYSHTGGAVKGVHPTATVLVQQRLARSVV